MNRHEANQITNHINNFPIDKVEVTQVIQSAVNSFISDYLKHNSNEELFDLKWKFEKQASNLTKSFIQAFRYKARELQNERFKNHIKVPITPPDEKEYIVKDAAEMLGQTPQNVNHLVKKHKLPMREVSKRKRYLPESTVEMLRTGKYN